MKNKTVILISVIIVLLITGGVILYLYPKSNENATKLCDCYTEMHNASNVRIDFLQDSCNNIHVKILKQLEDKPDELEEFMAAKKRCQ